MNIYNLNVYFIAYLFSSINGIGLIRLVLRNLSFILNVLLLISKFYVCINISVDLSCNPPHQYHHYYYPAILWCFKNACQDLRSFTLVDLVEDNLISKRSHLQGYDFVFLVVFSILNTSQGLRTFEQIKFLYIFTIIL